ncbi:hypothetical protein T492DRAFT_950150 [Pavlovales sp. CCMP2436]|nr:hypothetical protein T492DRAFT_950150 [Pavlovales sp. CCMP2436]|mmetsp:Transcript_6661/g.17360  ORF Transcript_6661/g.17360 Transcript_6661/m.17360 type:complete len:387 (+) Transcript_6661:96-1256(+)
MMRTIRSRPWGMALLLMSAVHGLMLLCLAGSRTEALADTAALVVASARPPPASCADADRRGVALMLRAAGAVRPGRWELLRAYAANTDGIADFWIQFDKSCPELSQIDRVAKCKRVAITTVSELRAFELDVKNVQLQVTSEAKVLRAFPALRGNWSEGERFRAWGSGLGRTQHELYVLHWWLEADAASKYNAVWVVEDDVRYGGEVGAFVRGHERLHGPCGTSGSVDYVGAQFKPTFEATGSTYLKSNWLHWTKQAHVSREFAHMIPVTRWVRKVEYVEKYSSRMLKLLHAALQRGCFAYGEFFASSLCAAQPAGECNMMDLACCPPTADHEYMKQCDYMGLPHAAPGTVDCVALQTRHWVDRIKREEWDAKRLNTTRRWHHPIKW